MRIAITTGVLRVPPTYFVTSHATALAEQFDFRVFALAADIRDSIDPLVAEEAIGMRGLPFAVRMRLAPLATPLLAPAIERFSPDLIHQHFATWSTPAVTVSKRGSLPLLTTLHGYDVRAATGARPRTLLSDWHRVNVARARAQSARFLAVSEYLAHEAVAAGFDSARLSVHYQGVDTDYFAPAVRPQGEVPTLLFVGALSELKGIRDLVAASQRLHSTVEHKLMVIGDGPLRAELTSLTRDSPHITLVGRQEKTAVRQALQKASALVLPTHEHGGRREAAGLVLLEAQACGTPVVAYDSGGTSEMLRDGTTGLLVAENDTAALERALRDLLTAAPRELDAMRAAARAFVVEHRSFTRSCEELAQHYRELG
jgi:glycosyltransferase involved in cell wall biosynthesis